MDNLSAFSLRTFHFSISDLIHSDRTRVQTKFMLAPSLYLIEVTKITSYKIIVYTT